MFFNITTNHQLAYQIKDCFESKVLNLKEGKGLTLIDIEVGEGYATLTIDIAAGTPLQNIFFLGTQATHNITDKKFNTFKCLPIYDAIKLLTLKR